MLPSYSNLSEFCKPGNKHWFLLILFGTLLVCLILAMNYRCNRWIYEVPRTRANFKGELRSSLTKTKSRPYLAYIINGVPRRENFTQNILKKRLPGIFNIVKRTAVPHNDTRVVRHGDKHVSALLLTHIDLWTEFGSKLETEYSDHDWVFIFEDDVDIVPPNIAETFYQDASISKRNRTESRLLTGNGNDSFLCMSKVRYSSFCSL